MYVFGIVELLYQLGWAFGLTILWFAFAIAALFVGRLYKLMVLMMMILGGVIAFNHIAWHIMPVRMERLLCLKIFRKAIFRSKGYLLF